MIKVFSVLSLLILTSSAYAQNCGNSYNRYYPTYYQSYQAKNYKTVSHVKKIVAPVAIPSLVPATVFQYLPALTPTAQITPVVTNAVSAPVVNSQVAGEGVAVRANSNANGVDIDRLVNERVAKILEARTNNKDSGPPALILPEELKSKQDARQETKQVPEADLNQKAVQILANKCSSCHTASVKISGGVTLFSKKEDQLYFQPSVNKQTIWNVLKPPTPSMPPSVKKDAKSGIIGAELDLIKKWSK